MLIFPSTLRIVVPVKTSFVLGSATVSASGTCCGIGSILFMVSSIFNSEFIVGSPASNEISVVECGALRSLMISFAVCF